MDEYETIIVKKWTVLNRETGCFELMDVVPESKDGRPVVAIPCEEIRIVRKAEGAAT